VTAATTLAAPKKVLVAMAHLVTTVATAYADICAVATAHPVKCVVTSPDAPIGVVEKAHPVTCVVPSPDAPIGVVEAVHPVTCVVMSPDVPIGVVEEAHPEAAAATVAAPNAAVAMALPPTLQTAATGD